jgi:hypothetical protein
MGAVSASNTQVGAEKHIYKGIGIDFTSASTVESGLGFKIVALSLHIS